MTRKHAGTKEDRFVVTLRLTQEERDGLKLWAAAEGTSPARVVGKLVRDREKGRLYQLDDATVKVLWGASQDRLKDIVSRVALKTVREELHRNGFTLTPYEK